jgi:hypothetical protein
MPRRRRGEDPDQMSALSNELLTRESHESLGNDEPFVAQALPKPGHDRYARDSRLVAMVTVKRLILIVTVLVALVLGGVLVIVT